jgi:AcrR family transcriptional regulator
MARQPKDGLASGAWQWGRTAQTQRALLDAARRVFTERGFSDSSIADIVQRAGSSVGSLYHHFGAREVAGATSRRQAEMIIDAVIQYARRL